MLEGDLIGLKLDSTLTTIGGGSMTELSTEVSNELGIWNRKNDMSFKNISVKTYCDFKLKSKNTDVRFFFKLLQPVPRNQALFTSHQVVVTKH